MHGERTNNSTSAFFAYPGGNREIVSAISNAVSLLREQQKKIQIHTWPENDISGRPLTDPIFENIQASDALVADVTFMNFNVVFEIGYAIGFGKSIRLVRNSNFKEDNELIDRIGIFDTLGYEAYSDQESLLSVLKKVSADKAIPLRSSLRQSTPVYLLMTPTQSQAMLAIASRIKKARLSFKSFIPQEEVRLSATKAIDDVANCLGAVVPLLSSSFADAPVHNIRAAFIAGLAAAMNKALLLLQPIDGPAPLDVRDMVTSYRDDRDIADSIADFALDITERLQADAPHALPEGNLLAKLSIGDPIAENEFQTLSTYYLRTDQFGRASRGEVNLVVGRKGAGKTALFSQIRDEKRSITQNIVVDLKPEGYQLTRLKEDVLDFLADGAKTHLITAFFEYVLYLEICYKVLEKDKERHTRDGRLYDPYQKLLAVYSSGEAGEGDFSERLMALSKSLVEDFNQVFGNENAEDGLRLTAAEVTELIHKHNIKEVREVLSQYLRFKDQIWILFDNLDKGWSSHGISRRDVLILRCLIDASKKIQRQMQSNDHDFHCIVFVRNDVYQLLVENSADYGKESRAVLDWTDPDLLRELLRRRLVRNNLNEQTSFETVWSKICVSHYHGEETSQYLIERSLMRPRNLLKIFAHCRGFAVNLGRERISDDDIEKGLRAYSLDLITEADQELTDIIGHDTNLIYHFIHEGDRFDEEHLRRIIMGAGVTDNSADKIIEFLIYYGFLGIVDGKATVKYIFDVGFDMKLLKVIMDKKEDGSMYVLNPAFYPGLNV